MNVTLWPMKTLSSNLHAFADKRVTGDFAALADTGIFLNFDERADLAFVADLTAVQVDEFG